MDDLISRQAAIEATLKMFNAWYGRSLKRDSEIRARFSALPSAQPDVPDINFGDMVSRQAAIDAIHEDADWLAAQGSDWQVERMERDKSILKSLPTVQPERLTDDDFETIRIHLNAYKENLCNQHRWKEAEEYQRIIDRFMAFASAQPNHNAEPGKMVGDCISRQAAIDAIVKLTTCNGVRELFEYVQEHHLSDMWSGGIVDAIDAVIGVPSAQPKIIHCGDCRYWKNNHLCECLSKYGTFETEIYFYCGFAERRDE